MWGEYQQPAVFPTGTPIETLVAEVRSLTGTAT